MSYETILYDVRDDGVATVTLNTPDNRNALSNQLLSELTEAFESARADDAVRCVVLTSSHEKVFSAGASLDGSPPTSRSCTSTSAPSASRACSARS